MFDLLTFSTPVQYSPSCPENYFFYKGMCLLQSYQPKLFPEAKHYCARNNYR